MLMKYSSVFDIGTSSMRNGMIDNPRCTARSTSLFICGESFAFAEYTRTITRLALMASTMAPPQSTPGRMSRGAIQQRMPLFSSVAQTASAVGLSSDE
jgi:hypothetical protein